MLPKLIAKGAAGKGSGVIDRLVGEIRKLPADVWPVIRSHWSRPASFAAMATYLQNLPANAQVARGMDFPSAVPVRILSAANATDAEIMERQGWAAESATVRHVHIEGCGHWMQLDRPDAVIRAVRELVEAARASLSAACD